MPNPFDRFDNQGRGAAAPGGNYFDRFDAAAPDRDAKWIPDVPPQPKPAPPLQLGDRIKGAGEAARTLATGMVAQPLGTIAGVANDLAGRAGLRPPVSGADYASDFMQRNIRQPQTEAGREVLSGIGDVMDRTKLAGIGPPEAGMMAGASAGAMPRGIPMPKVGPKIDPLTAQLAQRAESMGMKIPPDMLSDNRFLRIIGQASRDVPLSGSPTEANRAAFNRAIIKTFGGEPADKITPQVWAKAMDRYGEQIGDITSRHDVFARTAEDMISKVANATRNETPAVQKVIEGYAKDIREAVQGGTIGGETWRKLRSEAAGQMRRTTDGDVRHALSVLDDAMIDVVESRLTPQEAQQWQQARRYYANGKIVGPLIGKAAAKGKGDMSPAALAGQVSSGNRAEALARGYGSDLGDLSAVGSRFLTEPGSSLTSERGLVYGGLGGSAVINPLATAGLYGGANLYNRLGPALSRRMIRPQGIPPPP